MSDDKRSENQARAQIRSIVEMMACLKLARHGQKATWDGEVMDADDMEDVVRNDPLAVEVRSGWHTPGEEDDSPIEYRILLCTGGPAVQIVGDLNRYGKPETAVIQHQDWGLPFRPFLDTTEAEEAALLDYAREFFGE